MSVPSIGSAAIRIVSDSSGLDSDLSRDAQRSGKGFGSRFGKAVASTVKTVAVAGLAVVGTAGGVAFGTAMKKGFDRARALQNAEAMLKGLKFTAEGIADVREAALGSVRGTAYGLGEAMQSAALMTTALGDSGDKLARSMKSIVDVSALTQTNMGEITSIWQSMATAGTVTNQRLEQLNRRGLPVFNMLAEHLNTTPENIQSMVKKGEISLEQFEEMLQDKIGGAALAMGDTFDGAVANIGAALGRLGEQFVTPAMEAVQDTFQNLIPVVDKLGDDLGPYAQKLGETFALAGPPVVAAVEGMVDAITTFIRGAEGVTLVKDLGSPIHEFGQFFATATENVSAFVRGLEGVTLVKDFGNPIHAAGEQIRDIFGEMLTAVGSFIDGFGGLDRVQAILSNFTGPLGIVYDALRKTFGGDGVDLEAFGEAISSVLEPLGTAIGEIAEVLSSTLADAFTHILPLVSPFLDLLGELARIIAQRVAPVISKIAEAVLPIFARAFEKIAPVIEKLMGALAPFIDAIMNLIDLILPVLIPVLEFLADILISAVEGAIQGVTWVLEGLTDVINGVVDFVKAIFAGEWADAWEALKNIVGGAIKAVAGAIWTWLNVTVVNFFRSGLLKLTNIFSGGWRGIRNVGESALTAIRNFFVNIWNGIVSFFRNTLNGMRSTSSTIWGAIRNTISNIITGIRNTISNIMTSIRNTWDTVWGTIKNIGRNAWNWIRDTAQGAFNTMKDGVLSTFRGMRDSIRTIWNAVRGVVGRPINVVIDFINKGLIKGYNFVVDKLGIGKTIAMLSKLDLGNYAEGGPVGFVNKPWSASNRDPYMGFTPQGFFRFEGEEFIFPRHMARRHRAAFEAMLRGDLEIPQYASGGSVRPVPQRHSGWNGGRYRSGGWHGGLDFPAPTGQPIGALWGGRVSRALSMTTSYGKHVRMDHGGGLETLYAHMSQILTQVGQAVNAGNTIGRVGSTGNSTGPHLHLEVRQNGKQLNPEPFLSGAKGPSRGFLAAIKEGFKSVMGWFRNIIDKVTGPFNNFMEGIRGSAGSGLFGELLRNIGTKLKDNLTDWIKDKLGIGGGDDKYAAGTNSARRGLALVGEHGPELVWLRGGESIFNTRRTRALMAGQPDMTQASAVLGMGAMMRTPEGQMFIENVIVQVHADELRDMQDLLDLFNNLPRHFKQRPVGSRRG